MLDMTEFELNTMSVSGDPHEIYANIIGKNWICIKHAAVWVCPIVRGEGRGRSRELKT